MSINISKLFDSLEQIGKEKDIDADRVSEILKYSLEKSYLKENPDVNVVARIDRNKKTINLIEIRKVVDKSEDEIDDDLEINLSDAIKIKKDAKLDDEIETEVNIDDFERRIAVHTLQIFQQKLNEITNLKVYEQWKDKVNQIVRAEVDEDRNNSNKYVIQVDLGTTKGVVSKSEQIPGENLRPGEKYLFLIKEIKEQTKGWPVILSRTSPKLVQGLMGLNVPEVASGEIKIERIARIPGYKSKIAVSTTNPNIDPVGTCIGAKGERLKNIASYINNEKIDVFAYDNDPKQLIVNMCSPERIIGLEITDDSTEDHPNNKIITIVCDDNDVNKIIGKAGINVKLMALLTGWSIDVIPLKLAIEDKIEYEDVTHLLPTKFASYAKRNNFNNNNWNKNANRNNNNNRFSPFGQNGGQSYDAFDYEIGDNNWDLDVTDEDVENLLNSDSKASKRKRRFDEDDEEVIFVSESQKASQQASNNYNNADNTEVDSDNPFSALDNLDAVKQTKKVAKKVNKPTVTATTENNEPTVEEASTPTTTTIKKPKVSIDEFFDSYEEQPSKSKKNKSNQKRKSNKFVSNEEKKEKKKINVLDEFDVTEDDFDDSNNIDIDFDDYDEE